MWTATASVLNKQLQTADFECLLTVGAGRLAKTPHHENTLRGFMLCTPFGLCSNTCCYRKLTAFVTNVFYALGRKMNSGA
jgi:hypothetical protein